MIVYIKLIRVFGFFFCYVMLEGVVFLVMVDVFFIIVFLLDRILNRMILKV